MDKNLFWGLFQKTGNIEAYLLYKEQQQKTEGKNKSKDLEQSDYEYI